MKLKTLILLTVLILPGFNFAQEYYFRVNSGYGFGISSQTDFDYSLTETAPNVSSYTYQTKDYSFGQGIYFTAGFGYFVNQNIGIDLELQYLDGSSYPLHIEYNFVHGDKYVSDYKNYASAFMINPSFVLRTQLKGFKPYLKLGPVFSIATINRNSSGYNKSTTGTMSTFINEMQYSGGSMLGLNAALGTSYEVFSNINLYIELNSKNISYAPKEAEVKKYLVDGVDYLPRLSVGSKKVEYVENGGSISSQNSNSPLQQRKQYFPFSSLALLMGVTFTL